MTTHRFRSSQKSFNIFLKTLQDVYKNPNELEQRLIKNYAGVSFKAFLEFNKGEDYSDKMILLRDYLLHGNKHRQL